MARPRSKPLEPKASGVPKLKVAREPKGSILLKMDQDVIDRLKLHAHGKRTSASAIVSALVRTNCREFYLGVVGVRSAPTAAVIPPAEADATELLDVAGQEDPGCLGPVAETA
jgi:hypothetical protein